MAKQMQDPDWMDSMVEEPEEDVSEEIEDLATEEPEEEPEPEIEAEDDSEEVEEQPTKDEKKDRKKDEKPQNVPLPTFLEEKEARKNLERELAQMKENQKRYDQLWEKLNKIEEEKAAQQEAEQVPDFEQNPAEHLKYQVGKIQEQTENLQQTYQTEQQKREQQAQEQQALQQTALYEQRFASEKPDYYDALSHVRQIAINNMKPIAQAQGWSEEQIMAQVAQQEKQAALHLMSQGINPAEYMYTVAQNYGYQPKPTDTKDESESEDSLDTLEKGLKLGSKGGGGGKKKTMSKEFVENAAPEEFEQAMNEMFGSMKG